MPNRLLSGPKSQIFGLRPCWQLANRLGACRGRGKPAFDAVGEVGEVGEVHHLSNIEPEAATSAFSHLGLPF